MIVSKNWTPSERKILLGKVTNEIEFIKHDITSRNMDKVEFAYSYVMWSKKQLYDLESLSDMLQHATADFLEQHRRKFSRYNKLAIR